MIAILNFIMFVITTVFAAFAAVLLNWLLLHAAFELMRPATARRSSATGPLVRGTLQSARALSNRR